MQGYYRGHSVFQKARVGVAGSLGICIYDAQSGDETRSTHDIGIVSVTSGPFVL